jgi:PAS domain S-box-containing protein/putative nucleotidyltransferase with HDIG domain
MDPSHIRIMIVEDEADHVEAIRRAFEAAAPDVEIQVSGTLREYWESVAAGAPDIALVDLNLPDGRAVEVLTSPPEAGPFRILIMTAYGNEQVAVEAMKSGALDYIVKSPEAFADMLRTVARALREWNVLQDRKRAEEALRRAEENFRRSLEGSPLGVRIVSAAGETLYANRAILDIYGYDGIEELKATPVEKRYTLESYAEQRGRLEKRDKGNTGPPEYKVSIIKKNGEVRHLQVFRKEVLWNGERQFQIIYHDITERKRAENELRQTAIKLRQAFGSIIQALALTVERRDPYTAGHQTRAADLAQAIAIEMDLAEDHVEAVHIAGLIHDIGKISIPAEILSKPSRLDELEFSLVKEHPGIGYEILREIIFPWPIAQIVLQHHERINGSGYPQGLSGEDILLEARILGVADVLEAMVSHRPYRPAHGLQEAVEEISKNRGILYDSGVVDACLKVLAEGKFSFNERKIEESGASRAAVKSLS